MPQPLRDLSTLNLTEDVMPVAQIRELLPHAHEFELVDGVCFLDTEDDVIIAYKDWPEDPWWGRGHIPGRPIMPGVLMIEGCAQAASILMKVKTTGWPKDQFIGLGGVDNARFRGAVTPPARVYFLATQGRQNARMARYPCQAFTGGKLIFEMDLLGVRL
ncbi:MAG: 3-hydroxyacyl-ACP dehydratase FabZ family protein [Planctomycetota bacterium]